MPKVKSQYPSQPYNVFGDDLTASPSIMISGTDVPMPPPPPKKQRMHAPSEVIAVLMKAKPKDAHGPFHQAPTAEMMMSQVDKTKEHGSPTSSRSDSISGEPLLCPICHRQDKRTPFNTRGHLRRHMWKRHAVSEPDRGEIPAAT